jgi:hypothetical protein
LAKDVVSPTASVVTHLDPNAGLLPPETLDQEPINKLESIFSLVPMTAVWREGPDDRLKAAEAFRKLKRGLHD